MLSVTTMYLVRSRSLFAISALCLLSTGCLPKMDIATIKAMQPPRAPQLDRLDMLIGDWTTTGEAKMAVLEGVLTTTGANTAVWSMDRRMLIDHAELEMGELGHLSGMSVWTWDPTIKKYRMWWFDSLGETSMATVSYNEKTKTWHMRGSGQKYGYKTSGRGTLRQLDDGALEWTWKEYDQFGLILLADFKGISRRR